MTNLNIKKSQLSALAGVFLIILGVIAGGAVYSFQGAKASDPGAAGGPPPAMPVEIVTLALEKTDIWKSYSGRLEALDYVEVRPQVNGRVSEVKFIDGQTVNKGDVLMVIDPRPFEAAVKQAQADVTVAKNQLSLAGKEQKRAQDLIKTDAISRRIYDERASANSVAAATLKSAEARLEQAKINLDYAFVKAPISGRVSRAEVTAGNLVQAGMPVLTTIVSNQGIYADFQVDEQTYLQTIRTGAGTLKSENEIPVRLKFPGSDQIYEGKVHAFDNRIDVASGTIRGRAYFANTDAAFLPGMFVNVLLGSAKSENRLMVPERAVGTDQDRKFVYVVDDQNMVAYREVKLGDVQDGKRVVLDGLKEGDRAITSGLMMIRPGMPVQPMTASEMLAMQEQAAAAQAGSNPAAGEVQ